jgi:hypothetical protein
MLRWLKKLFTPKNTRLEVVFVAYEKADILLARENEKWQIAKEEDNNEIYGMVWLERVEHDH